MIYELKKAVREYNDECKKSIEENKSKLVTKIYEDDINLRTVNGIIPYLPSSSKSRHYYLSHVNLHTSDKNVLEYTPYVKDMPVLDIQHYEETTIFDQPHNQYNEIFYKLLKNNDTNKIADFLKVKTSQLDKLCNIKFPEPSQGFFLDLCKNFCSICKFFGCKIHPLYTETCYNTKEKMLCYCNSLQFPVLKHTDHNFLKCKIQEIKKMLKMFNNDKCMTSYNIFIKYNKFISCKDLKAGQIRTKKILQSQYSHFFEILDIPSICFHKGRCYNNKDCVCFMNGTGCDTRCLCTRSDFNFVGCKCKRTCNHLCKCKILGRPCGDYCKYKGCCSSEVKSQGLALKAKSTFIYESPKAGLGCFANETIKKGDFVIEYIGEIISVSEGDRRGNFYDANKKSYIFEYSSKHCIDANNIGNNSRFINHSNKPNTYIKKVEIDRKIRLCFFALRDIKIGEELFFNYNYTEEAKVKFNLVD
ncbi:histone-lysine N-methyltransferase EZH2 [Vairimorpha necatrix]|uniref:Histone-lysine N-methyltransferase EZH2 n=1 Tax=Vairimorpha necatrix TaxID=6039 RepID=A0AAX4JG16_9MICR